MLVAITAAPAAAAAAAAAGGRLSSSISMYVSIQWNAEEGKN